MYPTFFSDRIPVISREQSLAITAMLKLVGLLHENGTVMADPKGYTVGGSEACMPPSVSHGRCCTAQRSSGTMMVGSAQLRSA